MSHAYATEPVQSFNTKIAPGTYASVPLQVATTEGFYLIQAVVTQAPQRVDDVIVRIFDEPAYRIWEHNREAIRRGAPPTSLPPPTSLQVAKLVNAELSFGPPAQGTFFLVLDNTHSSFTPKDLQIVAYWIWTGSPLIFQLRKRLTDLGWKEAWSHMERAIGSMRERQLKQCCDWLRTGLVTLWIRVIELRTKKKVELGEEKHRILDYSSNSPLIWEFQIT